MTSRVSQPLPPKAAGDRRLSTAIPPPEARSCLLLGACGATWGALGLLAGAASVAVELEVLRDAFAHCLLLLGAGALAASGAAAGRATGGRALLRVTVPILALHAPLGGLVGIFLLFAVAGSRQGTGA